MHNPYLQGVYAPVDDELVAPDLPVHGELPDGLRGTLVQNSPNPRFADPAAYHWFDGDGMLHAVQLGDGGATYRNRAIATRGRVAEATAGHALVGGLMAPVDHANPLGPDKNTVNTDVVWHAGTLLALWWLGGEPYRIGLPDLETAGVEDFGGTLTGGMAAHAKVDPRTGELVYFDYDPYRPPYLRYGVIGADRRLAHQVDVPIPEPALLHDLAITERYTVLLDLPMAWRRDALAAGKRRVRFDPDRPARFGIVPRRGGADAIRWFEADSCYIYHVVNAWEDPDDDVVTLVCCRVANPMPTGRPEPTVPHLAFLRLEPYLHEYRFHLATGRVEEQRLDDVPTEFPRIDDRRMGVRNRFAYHPRVAAAPTLMFDAVIKYDLDAGISSAVEWGDGHVSSEVVFAPRPGGTEDDDGWLVAVVTDRGSRESECRVLDAHSLDTLARIPLPRRMPFGFHAEWVPQGQA